MNKNTNMIDLHTHSNCSDGSMTPIELVHHAKINGLSAIALTDHDSVDGISRALEEGNSIGLEVVPGIEFSVQSETETHILGFFIDHKSHLLQDAIENIRSVRTTRIENTCKKLGHLGFDVSMEEVRELAPSGLIGRAHFAKLLVKKGYTSSVKEGFDKYLSNGKYAYDGSQYLTASDAISLIRDCGGVSFLAHPHLTRLPEERLIAFLEELKSFGLSGLEGYYSEYTPEMQKYFCSLADKMGLDVSGGSDFHADMKPHISIGKGMGNLYIPYSVLAKIKEIAHVG